MDRHYRHGFSLVEAAIVLAVVGLVVGGIWAAAADVRNRTLYTKYVSELVTFVDHFHKNISRQYYAGGLTNYAQSINMMPDFATYDIENSVGNCGVSNPDDFCFYIGETLGRVLSQSQCIYIGQALRAAISGYPQLFRAITTLDDDGSEIEWWNRETGFSSDTLYCGFNILPMKDGPHYDTYIVVRF